MTRRRIGRIFLWIGAAAWLPYVLLKYVLGHPDTPMTPYLICHLSGVIPGSIISRWPWIRAGARWLARRIRPGESCPPRDEPDA
jgi:hypothetical protein